MTSDKVSCTTLLYYFFFPIYTTYTSLLYYTINKETYIPPTTLSTHQPLTNRSLSNWSISTQLKMLPLLAAALLTVGEASARYTANLPAKLTPGPVTADYLTPSLDQSDLDSPKLSHSNASTFDWWHFDAIALENTNASVAITFSNGGPAGFPLSFPPTNSSLPGNGTGAAEAHLQEEQEQDHALWAHLWVTFPDGRQFHHAQRADSARLHGSGDSSVAIWHGVGGWMGSEEGYEVEIGMQQPEKKVNITGRISMERVYPPLPAPER
jgi:hypothetical protein